MKLTACQCEGDKDISKEWFERCWAFFSRFNIRLVSWMSVFIKSIFEQALWSRQKRLNNHSCGWYYYYCIFFSFMWLSVKLLFIQFKALLAGFTWMRHVIRLLFNFTLFAFQYQEMDYSEWFIYFFMCFKIIASDQTIIYLSVYV